MARLFAARFWTDARHYQIAALSTLVIFNLGWIDFGARPLNSACAIAASLLTQIVCSRLAGIPLDLRSPLITGLSLSLLLRADEAWIHALAGVIGIGSKFVLRIDGKHIWNPAGFAIVVLLFATPGHVWISPGSWGSQVWFAALLGVLRDPGARRGAPLRHRDLLHRHARGAAVRARALARRSADDPAASAAERLAADLHLLHDLRPAHLAGLAARPLHLRGLGRAMAHYMAFFMQMRPALYIALIALSPFIFLIDKLLPAERFAWRPAMQGASR